MTKTNKNGGLFTYTHFNNKIVGVVALSCETDFAAKTDVFKILGNEMAMQVASSDSVTIEDFLKEECLDIERTVEERINRIAKEVIKEKIEILKIEKIEF